jgi:hypothetical protein
LFYRKIGRWRALEDAVDVVGSAPGYVGLVLTITDQTTRSGSAVIRAGGRQPMRRRERTDPILR